MIGIITFYGNTCHVGGGFVPALALKEWMRIKGIEAEVVSFSVDIVDVSKGVDVRLEPGREHILNRYDQLYFITLPIFCTFDISKIKTPYLYMIHGECDAKLYSDHFIGFTTNSYFLGTIDISGGGSIWYPCCMPSDIVIHMPLANNNNVLYAARVCNWLNINKFIEVSDAFDSFKIMGKANNQKTTKHVRGAMEKIGLEFHNKTFIKDDIDYDNFGFFWDVAGNEKKPFYKKRISLSAHEALKRGLIPIVSHGATPKYLKAVTLEIPKNCSPEHMKNLISIYQRSRKLIVNGFNNQLANNSIYDMVSRQVDVIIKRLKCKQ